MGKKCYKCLTINDDKAYYCVRCRNYLGFEHRHTAINVWTLPRHDCTYTAEQTLPSSEASQTSYRWTRCGRVYHDADVSGMICDDGLFNGDFMDSSSTVILSNGDSVSLKNCHMLVEIE